MRPRSFTSVENAMKPPSLSKLFQLRFNVLLFKLLPPSISYGYLLCLGKLYYLVNRKERTEIYRNVEEVFYHQRSPREIKKIAQEVFKGIFNHYFEKLFLAYHDFDKLKDFLLERVQVEGMGNIQQGLRQGRGVILATGHFGGVEFLPGTLALRDCKLSIMVRCQTASLKRALQERADRASLSIIDCDEGNLFYSALDCLRRNEVLITECDEVDEWITAEGKTIGLFGHGIVLDRGLDMLQRKSRAQVLTVFVRRLRRDRYVIQINKVDDFAEARGAVCTGTKLLRILERFVYLHPEQWYQWKKFQKMKWAPAY